jgi:DNA-binding NarL/FixJ family response regulator
VTALPVWNAAGHPSIMEVVLRRVSSPTFVGRSDELAALDAALARASEGIPAFAFVAGESGVGKSRLVAEFETRAARAGARVLVGHCLDLGGTVLPYAPLVGALRSAGEAFPSAGSRSHVFEELLALLDRLGPVALVLEDLHWADQSTRDFLVYLVRSARTEPLCLLITYRSDELHRRHPLRPVLAELERVPGVQRVALERFSRDEAAEQLAGILDGAPDDALIDRLYARSQGNPFFTEELLAASSDGAGELPATLRDALLGRFERLPAAAQEVVRVAAVVERPMSHALLQAACALPEAELLEGAREAVAHQLLVTEPDGTYAFRHALVGEAIYEDLLPGERTAMHAAIAAAVERDHTLLGDVPESGVPAQVACHWRAAHDLPRALGASVAAGVEARRLFAPGEALRHFEEALALWDRVPDAAERAGMPRREVLRAAAVAANDGFESGRSVALQREALAAAGDAGPLELSAMHAELAHYLRHANEHDDSDDEIRLALELLPEDAKLERARLRDQSSKSLMLRGHFREAAAEAAQTAKEARRLGALDLEAGAINTEGISRGALGGVEEGAQLLRRARDLALEIGSPAEQVRAVANLAELLDLSGSTEEALAEVNATLPLIRRHAERSIYDTFLELQGVSELLRLGRTAEAIAALPDRVPSDAIGSTATFHLALRASLALLHGDDDGARPLLDALRRQVVASRHPQWVEALETMTAELAIGEGRIEDARAAMARGLPLVEGTDEGGKLVKLLWMALRVEAEDAERASALGERFDDGPASTLYARLSSAVTRPGQWAEGPCYAALAQAEAARLEHALGRRAPHPGAWRSAAEAFDAIAIPWPVAYARLREAEAYVAAGDRAAAAAPLAGAREVAERMEAAPLVAAADALARRARVRIEAETAEPEAEPAPLGLTPREHEVLLLVAEGRTNREIGTELFMSEKTASVHVSRILAKLDVGGRVEAAAVAHRLGLTGR